MIHSFIITGFLGVGKSTMLTNTIQHHFKDKNVAIIVNEFGEVGVDHNILKNVHTDVIEITEGCICCTVDSEFENGINEIKKNYNPEIIFVEASGAAEPFPVFLSLQKLDISIEGVICIVDTKNYNSYINNPTAKQQLGGSNIIIMNKIDLVSDEELENAKSEIIRLKEENNLKNQLTGKALFKNYFVHAAEQGVAPKEVFEGAYQVEEIVGFAKEYNQHDPASHDLIDRNIVNIDPNVLFSNIELLLQSLPESIYRVKGVVKAKDMPIAVIVNHSFGHTSYEELEGYQEESVLVFIGDKLDEGITALSKMFDFIKLKQIHHSHSHGLKPSLIQPNAAATPSGFDTFKFKTT